MDQHMAEMQVIDLRGFMFKHFVIIESRVKYCFAQLYFIGIYQDIYIFRI